MVTCCVMTYPCLQSLKSCHILMYYQFQPDFTAFPLTFLEFIKYGIIYKFCFQQQCADLSKLTFTLSSTIGFLMISYFIVARCTFTLNFSSKLKSQFQVIFGHDSFPLKMSPFQVSLWQNSTNCLLANGRWNVCFQLYSFSTKILSISSCKRLVCHNIFLFCGTDSFGGLPSDYSFVTNKSSIFFFICLQMVVFDYFQCDLIFDIS